MKLEGKAEREKAKTGSKKEEWKEERAECRMFLSFG